METKSEWEIEEEERKRKLLEEKAKKLLFLEAKKQGKCHQRKMDNRVVIKMENDSWPNLIMLKNGIWFVAYGISCSYIEHGVRWIEFEGVEKHQDDTHRESVGDKYLLDYFDNLFLRSIAVNADEISFIVEHDS